MQKCLNTAQEFESFICIVPAPSGAELELEVNMLYYSSLRFKCTSNIRKLHIANMLFW